MISLNQLFFYILNNLRKILIITVIFIVIGAIIGTVANFGKTTLLNGKDSQIANNPMIYAHSLTFYAELPSNPEDTALYTSVLNSFFNEFNTFLKQKYDKEFINAVNIKDEQKAAGGNEKYLPYITIDYFTWWERITVYAIDSIASKLCTEIKNDFEDYYADFNENYPGMFNKFRADYQSVPTINEVEMDTQNSQANIQNIESPSKTIVAKIIQFGLVGCLLGVTTLIFMYLSTDTIKGLNDIASEYPNIPIFGKTRYKGKLDNDSFKNIFINIKYYMQKNDVNVIVFSGIPDNAPLYRSQLELLCKNIADLGTSAKLIDYSEVTHPGSYETMAMTSEYKFILSSQHDDPVTFFDLCRINKGVLLFLIQDKTKLSKLNMFTELLKSQDIPIIGFWLLGRRF